MRKAYIIQLLFLSFTLSVFAQEVKIFPEGFISGEDKAKYVENYTSNRSGLAGEEALRIADVAEPTITLYRAKSNSKSAATVVVCPGGGYNILSITAEGVEVCEYLTHFGFNAVLLKYRVPRREDRQKHEAPLEDAQRAISFLRANANEWEIDADKIGIMGFSAGAHLSVMTSTSERSYAPMDEIDGYSCTPAFTILIYPAYLSGEGFALSSEVKVSKSLPPTFIVQAQDDFRYIDSSIFYYYALKEVGAAATMHLYSNGGHGFGMRKSGSDSDGWEEEAVEWLKTLYK